MTQYEKGARAERRARDDLEGDGWLVIRAAGSHGPFDLWALKVRLIQVKSTEEPKAWTAELEELAEQVSGGPGVSRELWVWPRGGPWEKYETGC